MKTASIALATVRGHENQIVVWTEQYDGHSGWFVACSDSPNHWPLESEVVDVRPLLLIAPTADLVSTLETAARACRHRDRPTAAALCKEFADEIGRLLPRLSDPPTGWGAVVEDRNGHYWTLIAPEEGIWANISTKRRRWTEIDAVRVVSPGVPS